MSGVRKAGLKTSNRRDGNDSSHDVRLAKLSLWKEGIAICVVLATPVVSYARGASHTVVYAMIFAFIILAVMVIMIFGNKYSIVNRLCGGIILGLMAIGAFGADRATSSFETGAESAVYLDPPRVEVSAWEDLPVLERGANGTLVRLDGNGERDIHERFIQPIELRALSRPNPTKILTIPGQFNDFSPGDTIIAKVCGLEYTKETFIRKDKRYSDQIRWDIPVRNADEQSCEK